MLTVVLNVDSGSRCSSTTAPVRSFMTDAGLRCEYAFFSYKIAPVLLSMTIIAGFARVWFFSNSSNAAGIDSGAKAACAGSTERIATVPYPQLTLTVKRAVGITRRRLRTHTDKTTWLWMICANSTD